MGSRWLLLLLFSLAAGTLAAQSQPAPAAAEPTVQSLLDRIQQLESRISQLEERDRQKEAQAAGSTTSGKVENAAVPVSTGAPATSVAAPASGPAAMVGDEHASMGEIRETERHFPSLQIRGFGDVDFSATDQKGYVSGFNLGQLVLHLASPLSEKVSYFGEVSFTAQPTGYDLSVERTIIRFDYNDYFKLSFGKYHTPIGYWNATFHHGAWLQTTIARPEMVQFGGTFIPVHFVGLQAEGNIPSGGVGPRVQRGTGQRALFDSEQVRGQWRLQRQPSLGRQCVCPATPDFTVFRLARRCIATSSRRSRAGTSANGLLPPT